MNKAEFINYIAKKNSSTKLDAEKIINMFTSSVIDAMGKGNDILLVGFGSFSISKVAARPGVNPATGKAIQIPARNQVKFKTGQNLKNACNKK